MTTQTTEGLAHSESSTIYRRACSACTSSKRRCSKKYPTCDRCVSRSIPCIYPPTKRDEELSASPSSNSGVPQLASYHSVDSALNPILNPTDPHPHLPTTTHTTPFAWPTTTSPTLWFASPTSWTIAHTPTDLPPEWISEDSLAAFVAIVQGWFTQWTTEDQCPLMHAQLWRIHMPRCVQDAFTTLAAYAGKTSKNQGTVFRIMEERGDELVAVLAGDDEAANMTLREHLARVQALLVYQVMCLFDGNIRLRGRAEARMATLKAWNTLMWQAAVSDVTAEPSNSLTAVMSSWHRWLFLESVRRTWLVVSILLAVYVTLKEGYASCPGGITCTFGMGLWDAEFEYEWEGRSEREEDRLFVQSLDIGDLFPRTRPEQVDEFGHAIMIVSYGVERTRRWMSENSFTSKLIR